jgi:hypothetical protein
MPQRLFHLRRALGLHPEPGRLHHAFDALGQRWNVVVGQNPLHELLLFGRNQGAEGLQVERLALADELLRHGEIHAVRLATAVLVDPGQFNLELIGAEGQGAEHAIATGPTDLGHDVTAMGEGEERELDAESVTDWSEHGW